MAEPTPQSNETLLEIAEIPLGADDPSSSEDQDIYEKITIAGSPEAESTTTVVEPINIVVKAPRTDVFNNEDAKLRKHWSVHRYPSMSTV